MNTVVRHGTLTSNTVATVALGIDADFIEVINRGTTDIYFTIGGTNPTVAGNDCEIVTPGTALEVPRKAAGNATPKLISSGAAAYSVRGVKR